VKREPFTFEFLTDEAGQLNEVVVSVQIPADKVERFASSIGPGRGESVATYTIGGDQETHEQLVAELRKIESNLGFRLAGALRRIRCDRVKREYVAESPEEEKLVAVTAFSVEFKYPSVDARLGHLDLVRAISSHCDGLLVPQAFWLEGINYFRDFRYVQAFYSFYFIIEDFFGEGKTGEGPVLREFAKSKKFSEIYNRQLTAIFKEPRHRKKLEELLKQDGCEPDAAGLQKLLFRVRGNLHHYSPKRSKAKATPINQKDFESIALLTMCIAADAIQERIGTMNQQS
jgi:hypothetical protein